MGPGAEAPHSEVCMLSKPCHLLYYRLYHLQVLRVVDRVAVQVGDPGQLIAGEEAMPNSLASLAPGAGVPLHHKVLAR